MREFIAKILRLQASRYLNKNKPKIVVVTGSVGKTSSTQAIATVLSQSFRVRKTLENYNTEFGIPCSIFANKLPGSVNNPFSWAWLIIKNQFLLFQKAPFDVLVLELGTDKPGDIESYNWINADVAVVTAIAAEHMEYFKTLDAVAEEELSVGEYSEKVLINKNMVGNNYLQYVKNDQIFNYAREDIERLGIKQSELLVVGGHSVDAVSAAIAVGKFFNMNDSELLSGAKTVKPLPGRMQKLNGINNSTIIDDTYNSSPEAVKAALDYIYSVDSKQRIVLLGNMNELGETSQDSHTEIGEYCDPDKIDLVVTLGVDANNFLADTAKEKGCAVAESLTPYEAADIIKRQLYDDAVILCKGSQNGVFAEEAVKLLLNDPSDAKHLVRQSKSWQKKKQLSFKDSK